MKVEDLDGLREEITDADRDRQQRMSEFVERTGLDGVLEVIDEVRWGM